MFAVAAGADSLRVIESKTGELCASHKLDKKVICVKFSKDDSKLICCCEEDRHIRIFDLSEIREKNIRELNPIDTSFDKNLTVVGVSDDYQIIVGASEKGELFVHHTTDAKVQTIASHSDRINSIQILTIPEKKGVSPVNYHILTGGDDCKIAISDVALNQVKQTFSIHQQRVKTVIFSPDQKKILSGSDDKTIRLFEVDSGTELRCFSGHLEKIISAGFSSDGSRLISSSEDKKIKVFDIQTGIELDSLSLIDPITCLASSPTTDTIVCGLETGFQIISRLFNKKKNIQNFCEFFEIHSNDLRKTSLDFKPRDLFILPYPLKMTKLHYMIAYLEYFNILESIVKIYSSKMRDDRIPILDDSIFRKDSNELTPWDYWILSATDQMKSPVLGKLIQIITSRYIPGIEEMSNKHQFLDNIIRDFPSKLHMVMDAFMRNSEEITLPRSEREHLPIVACNTANPCEELIRNLYRKELKIPVQDPKNDKSEFFIVELKVCQITPKDIESLLEKLSHFVPSHPIFKSKSLVLIIDYLWDNKTKRDFIWLFFDFLLFLICVCVNVIYVFPGRMNHYKEKREVGFLVPSIVLDSVILGSLLIYLFLLVRRYLAIEEDGRGKLKRFMTPWMWLEILTIVTGITSNVMDLIWIFGIRSEDFETAIKCAFSVFFIISWTRLLDFARGFKLTSALIRLLSRVAYDMSGFLLVFFLVLLGMALSGI